MSQRKVFHTTKETLKCMFSKEIESDIIALLLYVDDLTDEEYFDDDGITTPSVRQCRNLCTHRRNRSKKNNMNW